MLRQPSASAMLQKRAVPMLRAQPTRSLRLQATPRLRMPSPKEEQSAHTVSQRLRNLKRIPPELIPLGIVLAVALGAAGYSITNSLFRDKTLRLSRTGTKHD
ncbi:hypothetical protein LTR09_006787 [Extremus antarcticus]|uniref:NADH-ubiquinone reductase complex 1 MLRQ subunit n=1 Tax=Extremus antarcticus TaxID=702011 RepID=A0AAJ0GBM6_9PEZI|nr:hypothetical protein LTR09_006787 [Extremus antarcticus]